MAKCNTLSSIGGTLSCKNCKQKNQLTSTSPGRNGCLRYSVWLTDQTLLVQNPPEVVQILHSRCSVSNKKTIISELMVMHLRTCFPKLLIYQHISEGRKSRLFSETTGDRGNFKITLLNLGNQE